MAETLLRFVQISDTHLTADPHFNQDGAMHTPLIGLQALVHEINKLPFTPDFVLHTGDVVNDGEPSSYLAAQEVLSTLRVPVYYVAGNHDDAANLQRVLLGVDTPKAPFDYEIEVNGVQIIGLDSNRPASRWCGRLGDAQIAWVGERCNANDDRPLIVAVHHPPLPMGAPWWDENMRMENGEDFHRALLPARARLRGVFSGHVHQNVDIVRDGIAYFSTLSTWKQLYNYPNQMETEDDRFAGPGFSVVVVARDQTFVRRHRFTVDSGSLVG